MTVPPPPREPDAPSGNKHSLTRRSVSGFLWSISGNGTQAVLRIAVLAILARLLTPADFGVVGAALIVISFIEIFGQAGVSQAIIQRPDLDKSHIHSGIAFSIVISFALGLAIFSLAGPIQALFKIDRVETAVQILALALPIKGFSTIGEALLARHMQFKSIALTTLGSYVFGYAPVTLALAASGWGVYALLYGQVAQIFLMTAIQVFLTRRFFGVGLHLAALKQLLFFGGGISLTKFANFFATNLDNFVVGRFLGAEALGLYSRAFNFMMLPTNLLTGALDRVLYSAMSTINQDTERLSRAYIRTIGLVALIILPTSALMVVLGPEIIKVVLGPQWTGAILPFQILSSCLLFRIGYKASAVVARAKGAVYRSAWRQWLFALLIGAGAIVGHYWGTGGVAAGVGVALGLQFLMMTHFGLSLTDARASDVAFIHLRHITISLLVAAGAFLATTLLRSHEMASIVVLAGGGAAAAVVYGTIYFLIPGLLGEEGRWLNGQVKERLAPRLKKK